MDFKDYIRKPFQIKAVEVTQENFEEIAAFCGKAIQTNQKGDRYILVNRRVIPNGFKIFVGWWVTVMDDNVRCYPPKSFDSQFAPITESGSSLDNAFTALDEAQRLNREIIDILEGKPESTLTTNSPVDLEVDED